MTDIQPTITTDAIVQRIFELRGQRVMLDSDLAELYGVETKALVRAVKRHIDRFPEDFMFQLSPDEWEILRCQIGTSSLRSHFVTSSHGGRRYAPYAFTEHGSLMLSSVLNSTRAKEISVMTIFTSRGKKITPVWYYEIWNGIMNEVEMRHTPHEYRHTFRSVLDSAGGNKRRINLIMGRKSKDAGERIYTRKTPAELKNR